MRIPGLGSFPAIFAQRDPQSQVAHAEVQDVVADFLKRWSAPRDPREYLAAAEHNLEAWPESLHALSFPSFGFALTRAQVDYLATNALEVLASLPEALSAYDIWEIARSNRGPLWDKGATELAAQCDIEIAKLGDQAFFKMGGRAPKNSPFWPICGGIVETGHQALLLLLTGIRAAEDLMQCQIYSDPQLLGHLSTQFPDVSPFKRTPWLWFREPRFIQPYEEFRCFMGGGEFKGASQYHGYDAETNAWHPIAELVEHGDTYEAIIKAWFPSFRDAAPFSQAVFDVLVDRETEHVTLIETNPTTRGTFPGLFSWETMDFDGTLRWVAPQ